MGIRVLIVEDEANIVESVSFILRREAGADAYITKPFSNRDLVEQVKRLCGG